MDVEAYAAWYHSPRGRWIGTTEFELLMRLLPGEIIQAAERPITLLDVGCGTGYFTQRFACTGLQSTGLDPDSSMLDSAQKNNPGGIYLQGQAESLPFADQHFDYCAAITSLCFVSNPERALEEMWRVARRGVVLGLLNRHSLLYRQKQGQGAYRGARWDTLADVRRWLNRLSPPPVLMRSASAVFLPGGSRFAQTLERLLPGSLHWGSFLAVYLEKNSSY